MNSWEKANRLYLDSVSPARVTGRSHDWASAGRKFRQTADKKIKDYMGVYGMKSGGDQ